MSAGTIFDVASLTKIMAMTLADQAAIAGHDGQVASGKLVPVLERREFAVPVPSGRASGTVAGKSGRRVRDVTTLDPADPVDRQLITVNDL